MLGIARSRDMRSRPKTCATSSQDHELTEQELDHLTGGGVFSSVVKIYGPFRSR
jgi:hypothetical protein